MDLIISRVHEEVEAEVEAEADGGITTPMPEWTFGMRMRALQVARVVGMTLGLLLGVAAGAEQPAVTQERIRALRAEAARLEATLPPAHPCGAPTKSEGKLCSRRTRQARCWQHTPLAPEKGVKL